MDSNMRDWAAAVLEVELILNFLGHERGHGLSTLGGSSKSDSTFGGSTGELLFIWGVNCSFGGSKCILPLTHKLHER